MKKLLLLLGLAALPPVGTAHATTLYWDGGTANITTNGDGVSQGGAGTWNTTIQNWDQGSNLAHIAWNNSSSYDAYFAGLTNTVTLGAAIAANSISFNTTNGYVITDAGNAANTLTVGSITNAAAATIGANVVNSTNLIVAGSSGTLTLTNASTGLTGTITLNGGTLKVGDLIANNGPAGFGSVTIGSNATFQISDATSAAYSQVFSGPGTLSILGKSSSVTTTLSGANTYTNKTIVSQTTLAVSDVDETDPNCNIGTGPLQIGNGGSASTFTYAYPGGTVTTYRPLIFGGTSPTAQIYNTSAGVLTLAGPVLFASNSTAARPITLGGNIAGVLASSIPDNGANPTSIKIVNGSSWYLFGSNTYTGGLLFNGGSPAGTIYITNDTALGNVTNTITCTTNGSGATSGGKIASTNFPVTLAATRTITFTGPNAAGAATATFFTTDSNSLTVASLITGTGIVARGSSSSSLTGPVRFINDSNNYNSNFTSGYGTTEFTSVANPGQPSSLGAGTNGYMILNSSSMVDLRYIGSSNTTTTRPIIWGGTIGGLTLEGNGAGTVQFLSSASLRTGSGANTLTLGGTNSGSNILAQVIADSGSTTTLIKTGIGKWVLPSSETYSGNTTINGGTLALTGTASVPNTANIIIASGATFDVSGLQSSFSLGAGQVLSNVSSTAAIVGSLNAGSGTVSLNYSSGAPSLAVSNGSFAISSATVININNTGAALSGGSYKIISKGTGGVVAGVVPSTVTVGGNGLASMSATASLSIQGGELYLVVSGGGTLYPPTIQGLSLTSGGVVLSFSGTNGQTYKILTSTNAGLAVSNWTQITSGTFGGSVLAYTNSSPTDPQRYYIITSP